MKKEIVIKVQMNCDRCRKKAMKLAASADGVDSIKLDGEDKNQLVVVGGVDPVNLTGILRKKIGHSVLVKVAEVKKDDGEKKSKEPKVEPKFEWCHYNPAPPVVVCEPCHSDYPSGCSIM